ncbi:Transcription factor IIIA [Madurella mycetomatis]|uniref:Transcription factor IIIA n=1 Tax=Madurella mycetomatis TaxID=100816 RepID=A0A175VWJ9_9PEZI|nr:Transcription factor IIIA [Madurella mycetomatis]
MKRKATDDLGDPPEGPFKRQQLVLLQAQSEEPNTPPASAPPSANSTTTSIHDDDDNDDDDDDDHNEADDTTTIHPTGTQTPAATSIASSRRSRRFPSDLKTIKCTYPNCPKTFNRPARLTAHLRSHTNDRPHKCPYAGCDKAYLEEKHLAQHVKGSHTHERKYACAEPGCGKAFVTATRLRRHAAVHEGAERFRCRGYAGCSLSFRKHQTLQRHVRVAHLGLAAFVCTAAGEGGCGAGFDTAGALRRHVEREHGELKFWCEECGKGGDTNENGNGGEEEEGGGGGAGGGRRVGFTTLLQLQAHMRKEHVNCVFCDVRCGSLADLERHVDMYHSGTTVEDRKTVECTWEGCGKRFTRVSNLNTHIRTAHEGVRFVCGQVNTYETEDIADWNWTEEGCGASFVSRLKLEEHVRYVHLGRKRPPRLFTVQSALPGDADEMSAAVPTRTIPCSHKGCPAKFIRHHDLDKHLRSEHYDGHEDQDEVIDPRLQDPTKMVAGDDQFWIESATPLEDEQPDFDTEWAEMRRLIDLEALDE